MKLKTLKSLNKEKEDLYWFFGKGMITELDYLKTLDKINTDIINLNKGKQNGEQDNSKRKNNQSK